MISLIALIAFKRLSSLAKLLGIRPLGRTPIEGRPRPSNSLRIRLMVNSEIALRIAGASRALICSILNNQHFSKVLRLDRALQPVLLA